MRVTIAIPAYNEATCLKKTIETLRTFCDTALPRHECTIVIADNGSNDATSTLGKTLSRTLQNVHYLALSTRGKGAAVRAAWEYVSADLYLFTDADLPYGTNTVAQLVDAVERGADIAVVSRMLDHSSAHQPLLRKRISTFGNHFLHVLFKNNFTDAQAGCKALSARAYQALRDVSEPGWFFDTRLLLEAERRGIAIHEIPSDNVDPRPRPLHPNVNLELCFKTVALRVHWWITNEKPIPYAEEPRVYP